MAASRFLLGDDSEFKQKHKARTTNSQWKNVLFIGLFLFFFYSFYNIFGPSDEASKHYLKILTSDESRGFIEMSQGGEEIDINDSSESIKDYSKLAKCDDNTISVSSRFDIQKLVDKFQMCFRNFFAFYSGKPEELISNWLASVESCQPQELNFLLLKSTFRTNWVLMPNCIGNVTTLLCLGADSDSEAEEKLKNLISTIQTIGLSPFHSFLRFYDEFYNFALSNEDDEIEVNFRMNNGLLNKKLVSAVNYKKFFNETFNEEKIDMIWLNKEAGNFNYDELFISGGILDKLHISVCQFNLEISNLKSEKNQINFYRFIFTIIKDRRFIIAKSTISANGNTARTFFFNIQDSECRRKFL